MSVNVTPFHRKQKKKETVMKNVKMIIRILALMAVIHAASAFTVRAEPCYPTTPFDVYAMQYFTRINTDILTDPGIHVILAGTGMPWFDPIRNPQCIGVIAGGKFLLFDVGDSALKTLDKLNLPINRIDAVFITHYHSDHTNGLGHLISHTWANHRQQPIRVYGPKGIKKLTKGFAKAAKLDIDIRKNFEAFDSNLAIGVPHEFKYPKDGTPVEIFNENGVVVKAFKNDHYDVEISVGYRIEFAGRLVVISGDTMYADSVVQNATGADLLIHEATNMRMAERTACLAETNIPAPHGPGLASRIRRAISHHIDTLEVAEVAAQAGAGKLVLNHIIPPIPETFSFMGGEFDFTVDFIEGMDAIYTGDIHVAKDGASFYLPPAPENTVSGPCEGPCAP
ncbi:MAG: MBL fold metallo-hydrolase [Desulfobacteraceae bacterium]|jgi:ribonuclease Z|nr:MAG: MBL fold metallo-hydrolase [Desulfobacteraceae bacterium]